VKKSNTAFVSAIAALLACAAFSAVQVLGQAAPAGGAPPAAAGGFRPVSAGHERVVVLGGKTYLNGSFGGAGARGGGGGGGGGGGARGAGRGAPALPAGQTVVWSRESGPGNVTFADANALTTTATFDKLGDYTLKVTSKLEDQSSSNTVLVHVEPPAPAKPLTSIATVDYSIDNPLWQSRLKSHIVGWIPHCVDLIENPDKLPRDRGGPQGPGGLDNFLDAGRKLKGENVTQRHRGYVFSNAWVHNIVESMSLALMVDARGDKDILASQEKMRGTLDKWIPIILGAQEPDGYLQTRFTLNGGQHWSPATRGEHEGYVMGYFLESAIAHYYMTKGKDMRLYDAAKKCADCWNDTIGPATEKRPNGQPKQAWYDGHQEMEKALVRFGRLVNDVEGVGKGDKYIKLSKFLLDCRGGGSEYDQSHVPVIRQYEAVGHSVRASYTYAGMSAVMAETGDIDYQSATLSLWDNIVNKKLYVTGGLGSGETSEGFGPDYSLRNNAYCESCANCGELFFQYNMNLAYKDAKYVSLYEDTIYNAILGDTDLKGTVLCYTNPLSGGNNRQVWQGCPCCVGNVPRALLLMPTWTYATGDSDLYVNLFVGSTMSVPKFMGTSVQMVQKTNYPWDGKVSITVNPAQTRHFALRIAVPDRQVSKLYTATPEVRGLTSLAVNGAAIPAPTIVNGYAVIERDWKAGDVVTLEVPMKVQRLVADKRITADTGRVALRYGPLIYNVETADGFTNNSALDMTSPLAVEWKPDMLEGIMAITGKYSDGRNLLAIPNYARLNRGGQFTVWMPAAN
jgi:uncharacterized protein